MAWKNYLQKINIIWENEREIIEFYEMFKGESHCVQRFQRHVTYNR